MARGVARPIEEKTREIDAKIEGLQAKINDLKAQKKELLDADRAAKLQKVLEVAEEKGLSVDDIIEKISK